MNSNSRRFAGWVFIVLALAPSIFFADTSTSSDKSAPPMQKYDQERMYESAAGKKPTVENVILSVDSISNAKGVKVTELNAALYLLQFTNIDKEVLISKIRGVIERNPYWLVHVKSTEALIYISESHGYIEAKKVLDSPNVPLDGKLSLALTLTKRGNLSGYPLLRESLVRVRLTFELLEEFKKYDGKAWNDSGEIVKISELERILPPRK